MAAGTASEGLVMDLKTSDNITRFNVVDRQRSSMSGGDDPKQRRECLTELLELGAAWFIKQRMV